MGKLLIIIGLSCLLMGLVLHFTDNKLGSLPGDIRYETDQVKVYIPITTMLVISAVLSLVSWLVRKFL